MKVMIMKQKEVDKIKKIISILLLVFWCGLIFYFSNQKGDISRVSSSRVINLLNKILNINLYKYDNSVFIVRKLSHMFLYYMLYLFSLNVVSKFNIQKKYLYSFIFCLLYSGSDEIHQLFIAERTFKYFDILVDMIGTIFSLGVVRGIKYLKKE